MLKQYRYRFVFLSTLALFTVILVPRAAEAGTMYVYNSQFGSNGTSTGQFSSAQGIAISSSTGNIYVTDTTNNRIEIFNASGTYVSQFGSAGTSTGQFNAPTTIAVDSLGNVYVGDSNNQRVLVFSSSGGYESQVGGPGFSNGQFVVPGGIALDSSGNIYVTDNDFLSRVQVFNSSGVYQSQFGTEGSGNNQFFNPYGIAVDSSGNIYVADFGNNAIKIYNSSQVYQSQIPLSIVENIAVNSLGNIYADTAGSSVVSVFNSSGTLLTTIGSSGSGNGQFNTPEGIALDSSGDVYVVDNGNHRVEEFSPAFAPTLTTQSASSISATGVTGNGTIVSTGGINPTVEGFVYGLTAAYGATTTTGGSFSAGAFTGSITGLTCNTGYHAAAYATNLQGTSYGSDITFTTSACPVTATVPTPVYAGQGGGQASYSDLASILAPGPATSAYLNSLKSANTPSSLSGCPVGWICTPNTVTTTLQFTRNLAFGSIGPDVMSLQRFLNSHGFTLAPSGPGSSGYETTFFGPLTGKALVDFQLARGLPGTGYFGEMTRQVVNSLIR